MFLLTGNFSSVMRWCAFFLVFLLFHPAANLLKRWARFFIVNLWWYGGRRNNNGVYCFTAPMQILLRCIKVAKGSRVHVRISTIVVTPPCLRCRHIGQRPIEVEHEFRRAVRDSQQALWHRSFWTCRWQSQKFFHTKPLATCWHAWRWEMPCPLDVMRRNQSITKFKPRLPLDHQKWHKKKILCFWRALKNTRKSYMSYR